MKRNLAWFALGAISAIAVHVCIPFFATSRRLPDPVTIQRSCDVLNLVAELGSLRSGDTNWAIEALEEGLDSRITDAGNNLNSREAFTKEMANKAVLNAKEYRSKFPRKTLNDKIDNSVGKVFSKVK